MGRYDYYKPGDFNRICDRCGLKRKASETREEWNGKIVCADGCFEERHPQDFVRGKYDDQRVDKPRPDTEPVYVSPTDITADDL